MVVLRQRGVLRRSLCKRTASRATPRGLDVLAAVMKNPHSQSAREISGSLRRRLRQRLAPHRDGGGWDRARRVRPVAISVARLGSTTSPKPRRPWRGSGRSPTRKVSLRFWWWRTTRCSARCSRTSSPPRIGQVIHGTPVRFEVEVVSGADDSAHGSGCSTRTFDLVVLDIFMPERSSVDVLPQVRQILGPRAAVVMISSDAKMDLLARCILLGADSYVPKPLALETVRGCGNTCCTRTARCSRARPSSRRSPTRRSTRWTRFARGLRSAGARPRRRLRRRPPPRLGRAAAERVPPAVRPTAASRADSPPPLLMRPRRSPRRRRPHRTPLPQLFRAQHKSSCAPQHPPSDRD